jgi:hypothetical protein
MNRRKPVISIFLLAVVAVLSIFGGSWSRSNAGTTVPTQGPASSGGETALATKIPGDLAGRFDRVECMSAFLGPETHLDQFFLLQPGTSSLLVWGGVDNAPGTACLESTQTVCGIPVRFLPKREQLYFYRQGIEVLQFVDGSQNDSDSCGPKEVYFVLTRYERFMYDHHPEKFGLYAYNPGSRTWEVCPRVRMDLNSGDYGRITCSTNRWGYFALGWPAKK